MKISSFSVLTLCSALAITSCANTTLTKQDVGSVAGGVIGGVLGNQVHGKGKTAAIIGGTLVGACLGGAIGHSMDITDQINMNKALEDMPTNKTKAWTNPDSGTTYQVTPTRTYKRDLPNGETQPCREFTTHALIGGKRQEMYGTACRQDDGAWKIMQ